MATYYKYPVYKKKKKGRRRSLLKRLFKWLKPLFKWLLIIGVIVAIILLILSLFNNKDTIDYDYPRNSGGGAVILNERYKYSDADLLTGISDLDPDASNILINPVRYRTRGLYDVVYQSGNERRLVRVAVETLDNRIHMTIKASDAPVKYYLRKNCKLNLMDLLDLMLIRSFKSIELSDAGYLANPSPSGVFNIRLTVIGEDGDKNWNTATIVANQINNSNQVSQPLITWWTQVRRWVRNNLSLDI